MRDRQPMSVEGPLFAGLLAGLMSYWLYGTSFVWSVGYGLALVVAITVWEVLEEAYKRRREQRRLFER